MRSQLIVCVVSALLLAGSLFAEDPPTTMGNVRKIPKAPLSSPMVDMTWDQLNAAYTEVEFSDIDCNNLKKVVNQGVVDHLHKLETAAADAANGDKGPKKDLSGLSTYGF